MSDNNPIYEKYRGVIGGKTGTWVPLDRPGEIPEEVSTDPTKPSIDAEGNYYYADPVVPKTVEVGSGPKPISANNFNAIPTPSSVVQLPPIVQPISLVPFTSQNQPLVQYESSYRPSIPETQTPEPVYRRKPYTGISATVSMLSLLLIVIGCLATVFSGLTGITCVANLIKENLITDLLNGKSEALYPVIEGVIFGLVFVFSLIVAINALVKIGALKPLKKLNGWVLASIILLVGATVIMFLKNYTCGIGVYIMLGILIVELFIPVIGIKKNAQVIDYAASKQTYTAER